MRKEIVLLMLSIFFIFNAGCEKFNFLKPKKGETEKKEKPVTNMPPKGPIVAKINNFLITLEDLEQEVENYNAMVPQDRPELKIDTRNKKIDYLKKDLTQRLLLYQEALDRGLDKDEKIIKALERTKQDLLLMELIRQEAEKVEVTSKEIEDYYNTFKDQLKEPEERQIREIVVPNEQEAKDILIQLLQGADFATLAKERSKSASAKNGGDLGFIKPGQKFSQFDAVAFSDTLEVGKISNIFKGPEGYYILKLEAKRGGKQKALTELWDDIKRGLTFLKQQERINKLMETLSSPGRAKIEYYEGEIKK